MLLSQLLHEIRVGVCSQSQARALREHGGWKVPLSIYVDAMSVFAAVTAAFVKEPAEKALWAHVKYLRELLDNQVLSYIVWLDTRDMISDGLTKGVIERDALHDAMAGALHVNYACKSWKSTCSVCRNP